MSIYLSSCSLQFQLAVLVQQHAPLRDVLKVAVAETRRILDLDEVSLYQGSSRSWSQVAIAQAPESEGRSPLPLLPAEPLMKFLSQFQFLQATAAVPQAVADLAASLVPEWPEEAQHWLVGQRVRGCAVVPVVVNGELWGCLGCWHSLPCSWSAEMMRVLDSTGVMMAIALQQAELERQAQLSRRHELKACPSRMAASMAPAREVQEPCLQEAQTNGALRQADCRNCGTVPGAEPKAESLADSLLQGSPFSFPLNIGSDSCSSWRTWFNRLLETSQDFLWEDNEQGFYTYVSPQVQPILGYAPDEMIGRHQTEFMPPDETQRIRKLIVETNQTQVPLKHLTLFVHQQGYPITLETIAVPVFDGAGRFKGYRGLDRNVSDRQRVEQETQLLLNILQDLNQAPNLKAALGIAVAQVCQTTGLCFGDAWIPDAAGERLVCLPEATYLAPDLPSNQTRQSLEVFKQTSSETTFRKGEGLPGRIWATQEAEWIPDISQASHQFIQHELADQCGLKATFGVPILAPAEAQPDGSGEAPVIAVLIFFSSKPYACDPHLVQLVLAIASQLGTVMQLKQAEAELRQREKQLRLTFEYGPIGMNMSDGQGRFFRVNRAFCQMLGYSKAELIGKTCLELSHPDDLALSQDIFNRFIRSTRSHIQMEKRYVKKDGGDVHVFLGIGVIRDEEGRPVYFICQALDISQQKQMEAVLSQQAREEWFARKMLDRIRQTLNLDDVLVTAVREVQQFLDVDRVLIYQFQPDGSGQITYESSKEPELCMLHRAIYDPCFMKDSSIAYLNGKVSVIDDINEAELQDCYRAMLIQFQVRAVLVVPIVQERQLWGLLLVHQCRAPRPWLMSEIDLMKQIADQLAIAIHQSELYARLNQFNENLENQVRVRTQQIEDMLNFEAVLRTITTKIRESLDEDYILSVAVQELKQALSAISCDTALYDLTTGQATICHEASNEAYSFRGTASPVQVFDDIIPQLSRGECLQFCEQVSRPPIDGVEVRSILACPIRDEQTLLGDIWLFRPVEMVFSEMEMRLARQVADQCAIAIRQSRLYRKAAAQVQQLERLNQLKDDFLSTVSHELRTPMASIKVAADMLEISLLEVGDDVVTDSRCWQYLGILKHECKREITLIDDLLDLSRLDAETEPLLLSQLRLQDWIPYITHLFEDRIRQQNQRLELSVLPSLPPVTTDFSYLERILTELLHNACKYTPPGKQIRVRVNQLAPSQQPRTQRRILNGVAHWLELTVSNSGVEIPLEERDRIFDKFYRIPNADPWRHGGTGLGLALVKKLVEHLGGEITLDSEDDWTHFVLRLPSQMRPGLTS